MFFFLGGELPRLGRQAIRVHIASWPSLLHVQVLQSRLNVLPGSHCFLTVTNKYFDFFQWSWVWMTNIRIISSPCLRGHAIKVQAATFPSLLQVHVLQSRLNTFPGSHCCSRSVKNEVLEYIVVRKSILLLRIVDYLVWDDMPSKYRRLLYRLYCKYTCCSRVWILCRVRIVARLRKIMKKKIFNFVVGIYYFF